MSKINAFSLKMIAGVAIASCMTIAQADGAKALSLNFDPTGTSLDADAPKDIATTVGAFLTFNLSLDTTGVASDDQVSAIDYALKWDAKELKLTNFTTLIGSPSVTTPVSNVVFTQSFSSNILPNLKNGLATVTFEVLSGLKDDGKVDFSTKFTKALNQNGVKLANLRGSQIQEVEVQGITPAGNSIPTPALLPGMFAVGVGMLRKRQAKAVNG